MWLECTLLLLLLLLLLLWVLLQDAGLQAVRA
jgi:hypothetical protein